MNPRSGSFADIRAVEEKHLPGRPAEIAAAISKERNMMAAHQKVCLSFNANTLEVLSLVLTREANLNLCTCCWINYIIYISELFHFRYFVEL